MPDIAIRVENSGRTYRLASRGRSDSLAGESRIRHQNDFLVDTAKGCVEELQKSGMTEQRISQRRRYETDNGAPPAGFVKPVGDLQFDGSVLATDRFRTTYKPYLAWLKSMPRATASPSSNTVSSEPASNNPSSRRV